MGLGAEGLAASGSLLSARHDGIELPVDLLPGSVVEAVEAAMARADPIGDLRLDLTCPACGHNELVALDVAGYVWAEVDAWARRLLEEVHVLASAYGWSEGQIVALGPESAPGLPGNGPRMSDYLTWLAARTLNVAPRRRPRMAARFESPPLAGFDTPGGPGLDHRTGIRRVAN